MRIKVTLVWLVAALWLGGCATATSMDSAEHGTPLVYGGTRLDLAAVTKDENGLQQFRTLPPAIPWLDLPFSLVADTAILPLSIGAAGFDWLFYRGWL
jgi:uncharacterized protein YceK